MYTLVGGRIESVAALGRRYTALDKWIDKSLLAGMNANAGSPVTGRVLVRDGTMYRRTGRFLVLELASQGESLTVECFV